MRYITVLWDWNGTLLQDVGFVVALNNQVFQKYGIEPFGCDDDYRRVFGFPIRDYYKKIGVKDEVFDALAHDWSVGYMAGCRSCQLREDAPRAVARFSQSGLTQSIISASKKTHLMEQLSWYPQINGAFEAVLGLDNIYAASKVQLAKDYLAQTGLGPDKAVFIGDTLHDAQVASEIGCDCVLVTGGHQLPQTLETAGVPVCHSLAAAAARILQGP